MFFGRINKKQNEEIGTEKSPTKPLYIARQKVERLKKEKQEIEALLPQKYEIEEKIKEIKKEVQEEEMTLKILQEMESTKQEIKLEDEKIKMNESAKAELENSVQELEKELSNIKSEKVEKKNSNYIYLLAIIFLIIGITFIFLKKYVITVGAGALAVLLMGIVFVIHSKEKREMEELRDAEKRKKREISSKIELIQNEILNKNNAIKSAKQAKELKNNLTREQIKIKYGVNMVGLLNEEIGNNELIQEQNYINELKLNLNRYELNKKMIVEKTENLASIEEELENSVEELEEILKYQEILEIAKEALSSAYFEMKKSITPRFTDNLSNAIGNITNGKYKKVKVNENNDLMLETENGNYVSAVSLSEGTVDQLYLSLRIASVDELARENMPIILDETFAFFDNNRLKNVLDFLDKEYKNKQIIIFSCTERETYFLKNQANVQKISGTF